MPFARTRIRLMILFAVALAMCWTVSHGRSAQAANASVTIAGFAFTPANVTVNVGDTVTWTHNQGATPHTVTSDAAGGLDSGSMSNGATYAKTFGESGSFSYHCEIHPGMTGTVVVTGAAATAVPPTSTSPAPTAAATGVPIATATAPAAATSPATVAATATSASATAAATSTGAVAPVASSSPGAAPTGASSTVPGSSPQASPSTAGLAPATGNEAEDEDGGGFAAPVLVGVAVGLLVLGGAGAVYMRRRAS